MSMIFEGFASMATAEAFAREVRREHGRMATVCETVAIAQRLDPFPFELTPPVVLVERWNDLGGEQPVIDTVERYGGSFAGT